MKADCKLKLTSRCYFEYFKGFKSKFRVLTNKELLVVLENFNRW